MYTIVLARCSSSSRRLKKRFIGKCVKQSSSILQEELKNDAAACASGSLPTPAELKAHLDNYVIGQEKAKRTLAVAVYNHYKRLRHKDDSLGGDVELAKSNILLI